VAVKGRRISVFGLRRADDGSTKAGDADVVGAARETGARRAGFPRPSQLRLMGQERELILL
jgi:hypothetical protein